VWISGRGYLLGVSNRCPLFFWAGVFSRDTMEMEVVGMIRIDISNDAVDKIREMLEEAGNEQLAARIYCVPG
jgi:hypothetical protein